MSTALSAAGAARPTRAGRLADYIAQLFPPLVYVPSSIATYLAIDFALQAKATRGPLTLAWPSFVGATSVVLFALLLRVSDELKDADSDRRLAAEGDPRYRDRVLVTGRVQLEDLIALRGAVRAALFVLNLTLLSPIALAGFAVTYAVVWASGRWFFWPRIRASLLLAFATHSPLAIVIGGYVVAVHAGTSTHGLDRGVAVAAVLASWLPIAAWELSRKVRVPEDETSYQTYSSVLGWRRAAWLPAIAASAATACYAVLARQCSLSPYFLAAVLAANAGVVAAGALFRLRPSRRSANLRPAAEAYALVASVGLLFALVAAHGIRLA